MLRIATWNLERPTSDRSPKAKRLRQYIDQINADIWILTESHTAIDPGDNYRCVASSDRTANRWGAEVWVAIWSRYPMVPIEDVWDQRRMCCANIETPLGELLVYGTVLPWLGCVQYLPRKRKEAFLHALENQEKDWLRLRTEHPGSGLCVAGDFNQDLGDKHYYGSGVGKAALRQVLERNRFSCLTSGEHDRISLKTSGSHSGIDHIVLSQDWVTRFQHESDAWPDEEEIKSGLTDHFGVWVDLRRR